MNNDLSYNAFVYDEKFNVPQTVTSKVPSWKNIVLIVDLCLIIIELSKYYLNINFWMVMLSVT